MIELIFLYSFPRLWDGFPILVFLIFAVANVCFSLGMLFLWTGIANLEWTSFSLESLNGLLISLDRYGGSDHLSNSI